MDAAVKLVLAGATDAEVLAAIQPERSEAEQNHNRYVSCIKVRGRPILPPVMTEELRRECADWRQKAVEKEQTLANRRQRREVEATALLSPSNQSLSEEEESHQSTYCDNPYNLDLSWRSSDAGVDDEEEIISETEESLASLAPKSFREIYEEVKGQHQKQQRLVNPPPVLLQSQGPAAHEYRISRYLEPGEAGADGPAPTVGLSDSLASLNTVIEVGGRITEPTAANDDDFDATSASFYEDVSSSISDTENLEEQIQHDSNSDKENACQISGKVRPEGERITVSVLTDRNSNLSERKNPIVEVSKEEEQEVEVDVKEVSVSDQFRGRRGSYTLERPSPLLQAHIDRYGDDMSHRTASSPTYTSHGLSKFLLSPQAAQRPATAQEKAALLEQYLSSLAERPAQLSLVEASGKGTLRTKGESVVSAGISAEPIGRESSNQPDTKMSSPSLGSNKKDEKFTLESPSPHSLVKRQGAASEGELNSIVSELAESQKRMVAELLARQEEERRQLNLLFQQKQQQLISQILAKFPRLSLESGNAAPVAAAAAKPVAAAAAEGSRHKETSIPSANLCLSNLSFPSGLASPVRPDVLSARPSLFSPAQPALSSGYSSQSAAAFIPSSSPTHPAASPADQQRLSRPALPSDEDAHARNSTLQQDEESKPPELIIPEKAYDPQYREAWERLTAIAKGFLTRRLFATEKVQILKKTIRETLACAVQLHSEIKGPPSRQDLELHERLLAQLESACQSMHQIFFRLGIPERMAIIALNRAATRAKEERGAVQPVRRISAATAARLESKAKPPARRWSPKRPKMSRSFSQEARPPSPPPKQAFKYTNRSVAKKPVQTKSIKPVWK